MRSLFLAAVGGLTLASAGTASAHDPVGGYGYGGGYYGNGRHDLRPHWHTTYTPFGPTQWYGNGPHDLRPHGHSVSPWGGVQSYGYTPFGPTVSYNRSPGFGFSYGYGGGYGGYRSGWGW